MKELSGKWKIDKGVGLRKVVIEGMACQLPLPSITTFLK
jgi:hypothetical protein